MQRRNAAPISNNNLNLFNINPVDFRIALLQMIKLGSITMCQSENGNLSCGEIVAVSR